MTRIDTDFSFLSVKSVSSVGQNFFAFTNGQPGTCFTKKNIKFLKDKFDKIFSSYGSSYNNEFLIDRIVLTNDDDNEDKIKSKIIASYIKKIFYIKRLNL